MSYAYSNNYSGRVLVYPNQVPFDTDVLRSNQYRMVDIAMLSQTLFGVPASNGVFNPTNTGYIPYSSGICYPDSPADFNVNIGLCAIYALQQFEPIAYGNLGPITSMNLYKQAVNVVPFNSASLSWVFAAPGSGTNYYTIYGTFNTSQINSVSRPYYNSSNPATPNFMSAADTEIDNITFGVTSPSTSGPPAPPGGSIGMFVVAIPSTATGITAAMISGYQQGAVFITPLTAIPSAIQSQLFSYAVDTGSANTYAIAPVPVLPSYAAGQSFEVKIANTNTGASTLNVNALGTKNILLSSGQALIGGELVANMIARFTYNGTNFVLLNPANYLVVARAYLVGSQTVNSGANAVVALDTSSFDNTSAFNLTTHRFVPQVPGYYRFSGQIGVASFNSQFQSYMAVRKNGTSYSNMNLQNAGVNPDNVYGFVSDIVFLNGSTDYIDLWWNNNTGDNFSLINSTAADTYLSVERVSN